MQDSYFQNLKYWQKITGGETKDLKVIYGGDNNLNTSTGNYVSWRNLISAL